MLDFGRKRNILLATMGSEPQIVTIALYHFEKILCRKIDKIQIITTSLKNRQIRESVSKLKDFFKNNDYLKGKKFNIIFCKDKNISISDITNEREINIFTKIIYDEIKSLKMKNCRIDFLVAGGRKPMSIFSFLVASALFDEDDKIWYLISSEELLKCKDFIPEDSDSYKLIELPIIHPKDISPLIIANGYSFNKFIAEQKKRMKEKNVRQWKEFLRSLTKQETKILKLMEEGYTNKQISNIMNISVRTVEHHIQKIYMKFKSAFLIDTKIARSQFISEVFKARMGNIAY